MREVDRIDTTMEHKENMMISLEFLEGDIRDWTPGDRISSEKIIFNLFRLCSHFLGYGGYSSSTKVMRPYIPTYWQTPGGYFTTLLQKQKKGGSAERAYRRDRDNAIAVRRELIHGLQQKGYTDFRIALILNTTEYEIKKLKRI